MEARGGASQTDRAGGRPGAGAQARVPTCGRHDVLGALAAELGQQAGLARAREPYAHQVILRPCGWRSLAAQCSKTLPREGTRGLFNKNTGTELSNTISEYSEVIKYPITQQEERSLQSRETRGHQLSP